ncbi:hypothetical protein PRZ48_002210 [Zasmidium cellare]|uniref:Glutaredoxin domain-containing protein n=1 Tax=Zasmidium cellare TaxID=395010 RepID=A0ABR0F3D7_ZASCE|nr:hypothetical protein PRZ48_002210 [Zasmidium cellare]
MPSSRQYRVIAMVAVLTLLVLYYVTNGERLTHDNEFYKKTVAAIEHKKDAAARQQVIEEEKARLDRVERLQKEHDAAMATATATAEAEIEDAHVGPKPQKQKPIVEDAKEASGEKSVAGRKKMKDGKVVGDKPASDKDDGVAKVGNVEAKATSVAKGEEKEDDEESEREHEIELELNSILKKGPIIIFSKSYCPFSKKAKHILLDLYTISPPPYVVELDEHPLGPGLQDALQKSTGRRTVPNILINGKSIGGGDDVQELHQDQRLVETVKAMGGKRIMEVVRKDSSEREKDKAGRAEVKFKA